MSTFREHLEEMAAVGLFIPEAFHQHEDNPPDGFAELVARDFDAPPLCPWHDNGEDDITSLVRSYFPPRYLQRVCDGRRAMAAETK